MQVWFPERDDDGVTLTYLAILEGVHVLQYWRGSTYCKTGGGQPIAPLEGVHVQYCKVSNDYCLDRKVDSCYYG